MYPRCLMYATHAPVHRTVYRTVDLCRSTVPARRSVCEGEPVQFFKPVQATGARSKIDSF